MKVVEKSLKLWISLFNRPNFEFAKQTNYLVSLESFVKEFLLNFGNPANINKCRCAQKRPQPKLQPTLIK